MRPYFRLFRGWSAVLLFFLCHSGISIASDVSLAWDPSPSTNVSGYKVYIGKSTRSYGVPIKIGNQTTYTVTGLPAGSYCFTVTAYDISGNESDYSNEISTTISHPADAISPIIAIHEPTAEPSYTASANTIRLSGTASDNAGVTQVTWRNSLGGSGAASGATSWIIPDIELHDGSNVITVMTQDAAGNTGTDDLTVTYTPSADIILPSIAITSPTTVTNYTAEANTIRLGGTASDNGGMTQVTWTNSLGGSGTASGASDWTISDIALQSGLNVITVKIRDAMGNTGTVALNVTYTPPDTTAPMIAITSPTTSASYPASAPSISLGGVVADNVGVTQVTWTNGLGESGIASGATIWTIHGITLQSGLNVITVTARDAAGNTGTDDLTVLYTPPDRTAPTMADFNGDMKSDLLWRNSRTGEVQLWLMDGLNPINNISLGTVPDLGWQIAGVGDFNGDGSPDILWRHYEQGENYVWFMNGTVHVDGCYLEAQRDLNWKMVGIGDFNNDGNPDILWRHQTKESYTVWFMNGIAHVGESDLNSPKSLYWHVAGIADFNSDGNSDILWRNTSTSVNRLALMSGTNLISDISLSPVLNRKDKIIGIGAYDGDGQIEILWSDARTGTIHLWEMSGSAQFSARTLDSLNAKYLVTETGQAAAGLDFDNDGNTDLLWRDQATGANYVWFLNGANYNGGAFLESGGRLSWKIAAAADFNDDGTTDLVWRNSATGENSLWFMDGVKRMASVALESVPDANFKIAAAADFNNDGMPELLWRNSATGDLMLWYMNGANFMESAVLETNPDLNQHIVSAGDFNQDGVIDLLWSHDLTGEISVWYMNGASHVGTARLNGMSDLNWKIAGAGDYNRDGCMDILWRNLSTGENSIGYMDGVNLIGMDSLPTVAGTRWQIMGQDK